MLELPFGQVDPDRARAKLGQPDRPLRGTAPELEHVLASHVAEHAQLGLRDLGRAPRHATAIGQLSAVALLVCVAVGVP